MANYQGNLDLPSRRVIRFHFWTSVFNIKFCVFSVMKFIFFTFYLYLCKLNNA